MENATKALLIAAAVLIVILVIALGMRIFNSTGGATKRASDVGAKIKTETDVAGTAATSAIEGLTDAWLGEEGSTPLKKVENYLNKNVTGNNKTKAEAITAINKIIEQYENGKFAGVSVCVCFKNSLTGMTIRYDNNNYDRCVDDLQRKTCTSFDIDCAEVNDGVWVYVRYSDYY